MRRFTFSAGLLGLALLLPRIAEATSYPVTPEAGAWLICVNSYAGDGSEQLAEDLAATIRRDYRLPAFVFNRAEEERQRLRDRIEKERDQELQRLKAEGVKEFLRMPIKTVKIQDSFAVLVGGYKDIEAARKALNDIRKLPPPPERLQHKAFMIAPTGETNKGVVKTSHINPFDTAFVVHNPTVPVQKNQDQGKLENLKEYNADEPFSLLKCGKPWTLMVKAFPGGTKIQGRVAGESTFLNKLGFGGNKPGELLNASAKQAHSVAEVLRKSRVDAYVLHCENCSYVCVGGFNSPDDPNLLTMQRMFAQATMPHLRQLRDLDQLSPQPLPMPVPKP